MAFSATWQQHQQRCRLSASTSLLCSRLQSAPQLQDRLDKVVCLCTMMVEKDSVESCGKGGGGQKKKALIFLPYSATQPSPRPGSWPEEKKHDMGIDWNQGQSWINTQQDGETREMMHVWKCNRSNSSAGSSSVRFTNISCNTKQMCRVIVLIKLVYFKCSFNIYIYICANQGKNTLHQCGGEWCVRVQRPCHF